MDVKDGIAKKVSHDGLVGGGGGGGGLGESGWVLFRGE